MVAEPPQQSDGNTSFLRAARAGHLDKVLEHLKNNVDINTSNTNGLNALHLASKDGHIEVVSELLRRGASVDAATKKGNTALHIASLAGQEEVVKLLVESGASVNVQSQNGFTPLYMAAQENHDSVVRFLLANGANQSLATEDGFTPLAVAMQQGHDKVVAVLLENDSRGKVRLPALHIAAKKDDCKAAALLLQNEHNPDVTSKSGFTPLHIASHYGNEGIAQLLLSKNADVNFSAKHNITPLHVAAKWGKSNMVALLLDKGANIEAKTRDGLTPLHCAARSGHEQVVDMLLERGAPISAKTKNGLAPLHMASQGDHVDAARILLYHRAPVDDVTVDYLTALHVAAHCGHVSVARLLLDRKADPNARALNGFTPLHIASKKNRIKVVELLLKHGASIEATTESGLTPLHVASFMGCMNIVIYLVQNEANPDVTTVRGETPLHLAARANQTDIIRILLRNDAQVDARAREQQTPLHIASRLGNVDIVMLLLQHGANVDSTTKDLYTALHIAAKEGQEEVAGVLLDHGASLEATTKKGFTPLHLAAKYGNIKVAKLLLQRDAPVDAQGKNGVTPLHVASHYDHQNVALLLLEKGASPHATAKNGHTPLHIAARKNQMDIATTLVEYGAKAESESKAGFTPLHLAAQEGHSDMANLLLDHHADPNHKAKNGLTPLHLCAQEDRVEVGSILLKNGAEKDAVTKAGYTPLHVACHFGQAGMVRLLLAEGASVRGATAVAYTPLHQAAQQGHNGIVATLLQAGADPNATTSQGQTAMSIAQKLGYISVVETLKGVTDPSPPTTNEEKYKVVAPETMQETFMSDSEDEGGEDTALNEQPYHYLTVDEMKTLGDDSLPIDVTKDEHTDNRDISGPPTAIDGGIPSPQHVRESYTQSYATQYSTIDNVEVSKHSQHVGKLTWRNFLVSFLVDARGGAMRGCRHSGVRMIVPPRRAPMPLRITCRYLKRDKMAHPPPLMEGEALASRILELGPVGAKFLGPVMIEVPHFASLRGKEREIVILRSDNGETWREHTFDCSEEAIQDVLSHSFEKEEVAKELDEEKGRVSRILMTELPHYLAVVSRIKQEVHAIGPEGGMVSSTVVPQVQAVFPQGALTKKIKVGLQAQPIAAELAAKLLGNRVAVSPIVTVEPRRRKFHRPITLTIPAPRAAAKGMINTYAGDSPTLRLLCSITGGTTRAQWEDVTGSTPLTFVNDCVSFTTTVSARFWLIDCRNVSDATRMATDLYKEAIHVPFMAKFVVFAKRNDVTEARLRVFCMTDDKEDKTLEQQENFTEVAKSRDVEVLEGKVQYIEFAGNLVPITKSGDQLQLGFRAFRENRLPFTVRVKDPHADPIGRILFMREPKVSKGDVPQQPICILNIVLPDNIIAEPSTPDHEVSRLISYAEGTPSWQRLSAVAEALGEEWPALAGRLGVSNAAVSRIQAAGGDTHDQALAALKHWVQDAGEQATSSALEDGLRRIGRYDVVQRVLVDDQTVLEVSGYQTRMYSDTTKQTIYHVDHPKDIDRVQTTTTSKFEVHEDDGEEKKYSAEEKEVDESELKSVSERKREIERRISEESDVRRPVVRRRESEEASKKPEKEVSEEKTIDSSASPEPAHLPFDQKRLSFELGTVTKEQITKKADKVESRLSGSFDTPPPDEGEESLSFQEKRLSFEKGLRKSEEKVTTEIKEKKVETKDAQESVQKVSKEVSKTEVIAEKPSDIGGKTIGSELISADLSKGLAIKGALTSDVPAKEGVRQTAHVTEVISSKTANSNIKDLGKGEDGDALPIPSPRAVPSKHSPTLPQDQEPEEPENYLVKKNFWETLTSSSTEDRQVKEVKDVAPVPKPRLSISLSQPSEEDRAHYSDASGGAEVSAIDSSSDGRSVPATGRVVTEHDERTDSQVESESEAEYDVKEHLAFDNAAFAEEDEDALPETDISKPPARQPVTRSVSLPCREVDEAALSVQARKRLFEEKIRKEMVVEQLMSQADEESPPEVKAIEKFGEAPDSTGSASTRIQTHMFKHELEEQIEPLVPERKEIVISKVQTPIKTDLVTSLDDSREESTDDLVEERKELKLTKENLELKDSLENRPASSCSNSSLSKRSDISSGAAEVLHYKNDVISKPSDSLEVHIDKSELEENEKAKEYEEDETQENEKTKTTSQDEFEVKQSEQFAPPSVQSTGSAKSQLISSRSSSQGESEDTFSESDVTPEDQRYKEQQVLQEWEKEMKKMDSGDAIVVYTPEEHIPDTVWEVPVQQEVSIVEEVCSIAAPLDIVINGQPLHDKEKKTPKLSEEEAHEVANMLMDDIEDEISKKNFPIEQERVNHVEVTTEEDHSKSTDGEATRRRIESLMNFTRTDTATSSMDITDEELRSSGVETDVSPLESQAGRLHPLEDLSEAESAEELDHDSEVKEEKSQVSDKPAELGPEVVEKTLAEVRESLGLVKEELIEEKKKKKDSITKESPSEFQIKGLVLSKTDDSIKEHQQDVIVQDTTSIPEEEQEILVDTTIVQTEEFIMKESFNIHSASFPQVLKEFTQIEEDIKSEPSATYSSGFKDDMESSFKKEEKTLDSMECSEILSEFTSSLTDKGSFDIIDKKDDRKESLSSDVYLISPDRDGRKDDMLDDSIRPKLPSPAYKVDNEALLANNIICTSSGDFAPSIPVMQQRDDESPDISDSDMVEKHGISPDISETSEKESSRRDSKPTSYSLKEKITSPTDSSEKSDTPSRKDMKDTAIFITGSTFDQETSEKTDSSLNKMTGSGKTVEHRSATDYSSSGESHYHSFDQYSDSGHTSSRPCSSDVEGLLANVGVTGSSEYESAISHAMSSNTQSSAVSSKDFQTAVSSLSSRDSMKSLDSESSGNLASMSSEASETLVPSTHELEKDMDILSRSFTYESETQQDDGGYVVADIVSEVKSISESQNQSIDVSEEDVSEDETPDSALLEAENLQRMKRSQEMTFFPEPKPLDDSFSVLEYASQDDKAFSSLDDAASTFSDATVLQGASLKIQSSSKSVTEISDLEEFHRDDQITRTASTSSVETKPDSTETSPGGTKKRPGHKRNGSTAFVTSSPPVSMPPNLPGIKDNDIECPETDFPRETPLSSLSQFEDDIRRKKYSIPDILQDDSRIDDELLEVLADRKSPISASPFERPESPEPEDVFGDFNRPRKFVYDYDDEGDPFSERRMFHPERDVPGTLDFPVPRTSIPSDGSIPKIDDNKKSFIDPCDKFFTQDIKDVSMPPTPVSVSSKASSEETDQGREYLLGQASTLPKHMESAMREIAARELSFKPEEVQKIEGATMLEVKLEEGRVDTGGSQTDSPTSDSFEMLEKPDISDEFVIIEEVGREADEQDNEGKGVRIQAAPSRRPIHDEPKRLSPPTTDTKMTKIKYFEGATELTGAPFEMDTAESDSQGEQGEEISSQEGSPPSDNEVAYDADMEANKKWMEMQFQGEPAAAVYGYGIELGPLEDIKEEEFTDLENSSRIGSMGSQVSHSIGSIGSMKESLSSTPDYDVLAGKKYFTRSGDHDDVSMSSLQEFERLERLVTLESSKNRSSGSQDSLTSSSNNSKKSKKSGGDDVSLASLKEFEGLESACNEAVKIEKKARLEEESLLSEIEEGHESQASESESCITISAVHRESEEEDIDNRMFEIEEIIKQAQANVEKDPTEVLRLVAEAKAAYASKYDSMEEVARVPDLDLDKPYSSTSHVTGLFERGSDDLLTSTESLEFRSQLAKIGNEMLDSTESLEPRILSSSESSGKSQEKRSPELKGCQEVTEWQEYEEHTDDEMNRMPPPRAELALGSSDSLPTSSAATHATYQYETDSLMSSSFTSADSTTLISDEPSRWPEDPFVSEVIEPGDEQFSKIIHRTVEMAPEVRRVTFKGPDADSALQEYVEHFQPGEDTYETQTVGPDGTVHVQRVVQKRVFISAEEIAEIERSGMDVQTYLRNMTKEAHESAQADFPTAHIPSFPQESKSSSAHRDMTYAKGGTRPPLKYDISLDEEPEYDPREHDWRFDLQPHIESDEEATDPTSTGPKMT